jgi:hypothetical protein
LFSARLYTTEAEQPSLVVKEEVYNTSKKTNI